MITREKQKEFEARRKEAVDLYHSGGITEQEVADEYRVHKRTIQKWIYAYRKDKKHGLDLIPHAVPECHLTPKQLKELEKSLLKGSYDLGFEDGLWSGPRISILIEKKFGLHYHPESIPRILHRKLGWSVQRPQTKAVERDEKAIQTWKKTEWPRILKKP